MGEWSYLWDGTVTGDAVLAPYDEDDFSEFWWFLLSSVDYFNYGPIRGYLNSLVLTNPSGYNIQVDSGAAIVGGTVYFNNDQIIFPLEAPSSGTFYYTLVIRKSWASKECRATIIGPDTVGFPSSVHIWGTTWDIPLGNIQITSAGAVTIYNAPQYVYSINFQLPISKVRFGDKADDNWDVGKRTGFTVYGEKIKVNDNGRIQCGTIRWTGGASGSGSIAVVFPVAFDYVPSVVVEVVGNLISGNNLCVSVVPTTSGVTIYWYSNPNTQTSIDFFWMATGPILRGY